MLGIYRSEAMEARAIEHGIIERLRGLSTEKLAEVYDFVEFLRQRDEEREWTHTTAKLSEAAFAKVWDNPEDAAYDKL